MNAELKPSDLTVCSFFVCNRLRTDSTPVVRSTLTVPVPKLFTSTLCSILRTSETSTASVPKSADLPLGGDELGFVSGSHPVDKSKTTDSCSKKENNVPEKRSSLQTENNSQDNCPPRRASAQIKLTQNTATTGEALPESDPVPQVAELKHSICFPQSLAGKGNGVHQDINTLQTREETAPVSKAQKTSLTNTSSTSTKQTICLQSSPSVSHSSLAQARASLSSPQESPLSQNTTLLPINPIPQPTRFTPSPGLTDSVFHRDRAQGTGHTTTPHNSSLSSADPDSKSGLDQDVPSSQTSRLTTVTKTHTCCQSSSPNCYSRVPEDRRPQQASPSSQGNGGLPEVHGPFHPDSNSASNISISGSAIKYHSKQSHQTVYSLHESLTSTCTQQCLHDPGMNPSNPAKSTATPQPESQTQVLAQQSNLHNTPLLSPPHLLTPDQDPNICQPLAIREEIRLTPQIKGPPLPAAPTLSQAQAESLPQGKASKSGSSRFTRPLSRATVMEGSPVTLEVEVTAQPEPTLTWWVAYNQLHNNTQAL